MKINENKILNFWQMYPCGDSLVGGLGDQYREDYETFFKDYDEFRYKKEKYILSCLDDIDFKGKSVLEIGLGQGADSEQIIRRGAIWSGLDLTKESVHRVRMRLKLRNLPYKDVKQGSALSIPFADNSFDIVFSFGVMHHVPHIHCAQKEIARVLKPTGQLIIMLYAKWSVNYLLSISMLRRLGLIILYGTRYAPNNVIYSHLVNAKNMGLNRYLRMENFIHRNTDGPLNPYSKVYDLAEVRRDFPNFEVQRSHKHFMHAPPLPIRYLPFDHILGWHLWVHLKKTRINI